MNAPLIPRTYQEWRHCITVLCKQPLSSEYIDDRIAALKNTKDHHTKSFVDLYGQAQYEKTLEWFGRARAEL